MGTPGLERASLRLKEAKAEMARAMKYAIVKEARRQSITEVELTCGHGAYWRGSIRVACGELDGLCKRYRDEVGDLGLDELVWTVDRSWRKKCWRKG